MMHHSRQTAAIRMPDENEMLSRADVVPFFLRIETTFSAVRPMQRRRSTRATTSVAPSCPTADTASRERVPEFVQLHAHRLCTAQSHPGYALFLYRGFESQCYP